MTTDSVGADATPAIRVLLLPGVGGVALALDHLDVPLEEPFAGAVGGVDVLQQ